MFVHEFLEQNIQERPEKIALISGDQRITYQELNDMASRFASALIENDVKKGDRVVIVTPNTEETITAIFGVLKIGGIFTVLHPSIKEKKMTYILNDCRAKAIVLHQNQFSTLENATETCESLKCIIVCEDKHKDESKRNVPIFWYSDIQKNYSTLERSPRLLGKDLACLVYTSGSTGEPKGVMESHDNIDFVSSSIISYLGNTPDDIVLNCLPLSFDYGLYQPFMVFKFGGTLVLERSFLYPGTILKRIETERITGFPGVPTIFSLLLQVDLSVYNLKSLRYITNTAATLPVSHIKRLCDQLPWVSLFSMYGLTECKRALYLPPKELKKHPNSVGIPIPGTEAWIQDSNGKHLPPGKIGELIVRGRHVMRGYWNNPEESAHTFGPGRFDNEAVLCTGDLFKYDEEGFFYFISRKDDIIKTRGEKVAPKEIEHVLFLLPCVLEAAVVGVPDDIQGSAIKAYIVTNDSRLSSNFILSHCKKHLENFMVPKFIEFRDTLPKISTGKISKRDIE